MTASETPAVDLVQLGAAAPTRPELPGLSRIGTKIARGLCEAFASSGGATKVAVGEIRTLTFAEWKGGLEPMVAVARYRERTMKGGMLISVPSRLLATLVDIFYGGTGAIDPSRISFGSAEQRLFDRFAGKAADALTAAWADVEQLAPTVMGSTFGVDDVALAKPDDVVVVQQFATTDPEAGEGRIDLVYPLAALRGMPGLQETEEVVVDEPDPLWRMRMADAVMQARLPIRTVIARPSVPLSKLLALAPGDFIPVTLPPRVPVTVAGRLLAHGTIGEANGRAAIKIDKLEHGAFFDD